MFQLILINIIVFLLIFCRPLDTYEGNDHFGLNAMFNGAVLVFRLLVFLVISLVMWLVYFIAN